MKKVFIILILIFLLTGCWNYDEVRDKISVAGIAIDKGEKENFLVTVEVNKYPPGQSNDPIEPIIYSYEGETIFKCLRMMISQTGKKLYVGHMMIIVIGETIAREGILKVIDFFIRDHEARLPMKVCISRGVMAKDILDNTATQQDIASFELYTTIENTSYYLNISEQKLLYMIYNDIIGESKEVVIPAVSLIEFNDQQRTFVLDGFACFKGDKLIGYLDPKYIPYYANFLNCFNDGVLVIPITEGGYITCEIVNAKTKIKVEFNDNKFHYYVISNIQFTLGSSTTDIQNINNYKPKDFEIIFENDMIKKSEELLNYIRSEINADILGIEHYIYCYDYNNWKKYYESYDFLQNTIIHFDIDAEYISAGVIKIEGGEPYA